MIDYKVKELSDLIVAKSVKEAECFPVDRYFLEPYMKSILSVNGNNFILYNFERVNTTYTVQLMLCLPELWQDIDVDDIIEIVNQFTNIFSFYAIITFTYKYIEINIINLILELDEVSDDIKHEIKKYLKSQYPNFIKTETDFLFFNDGVYGVTLNDWKYTKQRFLLDKRIEPALYSLDKLEKYITWICKSSNLL